MERLSYLIFVIGEIMKSIIIASVVVLYLSIIAIWKKEFNFTSFILGGLLVSLLHNIAKIMGYPH